MAKTAAEKQREYRERKRNAVTPESVTRVTETVTVTGPLDVYSESRWAYLQSRGYKWDGSQAVKNGLVGVCVPGDPGYGQVNKGMCRTCGVDTDHPLVVKCHKCCALVTPGPPAKSETFEDLPADVQASIERHCAEANNGARAESHSRAAMIDRALSYQRAFGKRPSQGAAA